MDWEGMEEIHCEVEKRGGGSNCRRKREMFMVMVKGRVVMSALT